MNKITVWGALAFLVAATTGCAAAESPAATPGPAASARSESDSPAPSPTATTEPTVPPTGDQDIARLVLQSALSKATDKDAFDRGKTIGLLELTVKGKKGSADEICSASEHREQSEDWKSGCTTAITYTRLTDPEYRDF